MAFASSIDDARRREFRRLLAYSAVAHLALILVFSFSPRPGGTALPAVVRVDLVAAAPGTAKSAPAKPAPPKPAPKPEPKKTVLPKEPTRPLKTEPAAKPKPVAKAEPAPKPRVAAEPEVEYDDLLAKLREEAGESAEPTAVAGAEVGQPGGGGRGIPVSPEVMAWMRSAKIHVTRAWVLSPGFRTQALATEIRVRLSASGEVLGTRVTRRSGNPWYDESVERAIQKASPLPPPPEADEWLFVFRPTDVL
jgi:colicin import membrane protein